MTLYRFCVNGSIEKILLPEGTPLDELKPSSLDPQFSDDEGFYMFSFVVNPDANDERDYFLLVHNVNDDPRFGGSTAPSEVNCALQLYFPTLHVLGDAYLAKVDGELIQSFENLDELHDYECNHMQMEQLQLSNARIRKRSPVE